MDFDYSIFSGDITKYSKEIAELSALAGCAASSQADGDGSAFLKRNGFSDVLVYNTENTEGKVKTSGFAVGSMDIGEKILIAVVINGTRGGEWFSNMDILNPQTIQSYGRHYGFGLAARDVYEKVCEYANRFDRNKVFWIEGHSRGGAVAGLLAEDLKKDGYGVCAYTFAAPNSRRCCSQPPEGVFDFINPDDFITAIPLADKGWGFEKAGKVITADEKVYADMIKQYYELTGEEYIGADINAARRIKDMLYEMVPTAEDYHTKKLDCGMTLYTLICTKLIPALAAGEPAEGITGEKTNELMKLFVSMRTGCAHSMMSYLSMVRAYNSQLD